MGLLLRAMQYEASVLGSELRRGVMFQVDRAEMIMSEGGPFPSYIAYNVFNFCLSSSPTVSLCESISASNLVPHQPAKS